LPTADDILAHTNNVNSADVNFQKRKFSLFHIFDKMKDRPSSTVKRRKTEAIDGNQMTSPESTSNTGTPVYVFHGIVPSNPLITILEEKLKPYIFHFLDSVTLTN